MKIFMKIFNTILIGVLLFILATSSYSLIMKVGFDVKYPKVFGYSHAIVMTGSMEPMMSGGDLIIFKERSEYEVGDVITYTLLNTCVTHRIIEETEEGFLTQGDANNTPDRTKVTEEQILGEVVKVLPNAGNMILQLKTPMGMFTIIMGVLILTIFTNLLSRKDPYNYN